MLLERPANDVTVQFQINYGCPVLLLVVVDLAMWVQKNIVVVNAHIFQQTQPPHWNPSTLKQKMWVQKDKNQQKTTFYLAELDPRKGL